MTRLRRWLVAFGRFWWDFLVGDTPEVTVGVLAVLAITFALRHDGAAADVLVPLAVAVLLAGSAWRAARRRPAPPAERHPTPPG
ncbi:MAG: hypothetical protein ACYCU7_05805 [Acidimicrobiales bacterium]